MLKLRVCSNSVLACIGLHGAAAVFVFILVIYCDVHNTEGLRWHRGVCAVWLFSADAH